MAPSRAMQPWRKPISSLIYLVIPVMLQSVQGTLLLRGADRVNRTSKKMADADVYYVSSLLDKFSRFAVQQQATSDYKHSLELERLQGAMLKVDGEQDKMLLEAAAQENEESRLESSNSFNEMLNFVNTLKGAMGVKGATASCRDLTCGRNAVCAESLEGSSCACEEGYEGDGFICRTPVHFTPHPLFVTPAVPSEAPQVADLHIAVFQKSRVAIVFRDMSKGQKGYFMLGRAGISAMGWNPPRLFSNSTEAYAPVIAGLPNARMAIVYRDKDRGGVGYILGCEINRRTNLMYLGTSMPFARNQAHQAAIVSLPNSRVAVMYSDVTLDSDGNTKTLHGSAQLFQIRAGGTPTALGKYQFASFAVSRLKATLMSPTSFVVAYRGESEGLDPSEPGKEASVIWAQMKANELMFDPHPLVLEPSTKDIWSRDVSLVQNNLFSYSYYSSGEQVTKQALIKVDPGTHRMTVLDGPIEVAKGPTPYVQSVSLPYAPREPHSFTYFQDPGAGVASGTLCPVTSTGRTHNCVNINWAGYELSSVAGQSLGGGRLLFVFTDQTGSAYYQFVGLFQD